MHIYHAKASIFRKDLESVLETMLTDKFGPSKDRNIKEFEKRLSQFLEVNSAIVVNSGTAALHLCLLALEIQPGDEVIVPSYSNPAILYAIDYVSAKPVVVDINHKNFGINYDEVKKNITNKTKAIYIPHLFGFPVDIDPFLEFEVDIIEDITDALGAEFKDEKVGKKGIVSVASFTDEMMITTGQGGAIFTNSKKISSTIKNLINYNELETYSIKYNYKLCDLLSALGINQLKYLPKFIEKRQHIASEYDKIFTKNEIDFFSLSTDRYNTYFRYIVKLKGSLQKTIQFMRKHKIETRMPIERPLHIILGLDPEKFPDTELAYKKSLSLPIYPTLTKKEVEKIGTLVCKALF